MSHWIGHLVCKGYCSGSDREGEEKKCIKSLDGGDRGNGASIFNKLDGGLKLLLN